jgi:leucyl aminopeptidase
MSIQIRFANAPLDERSFADHQHLLFVFEQAPDASTPYYDCLQKKLQRLAKDSASLSKTPIQVELPNGSLSSWLMLSAEMTRFQLLTQLRKALMPLLQEQPEHIAVYLNLSDELAQRVGADVLYVAGVNATELPQRKSKPEPSKTLQSLCFYGVKSLPAQNEIQALIEGNTLCRELTLLPPNELTPASYRAKIRQLAQQQNWQIEEFDIKQLKAMGAGAFVAVGQGSWHEDAAIVCLRYQAKASQKKVALVGKGICFDTGGHNLKPARYMHGMHEDMNGSAVALGVMLAASRAELPVNLECWLAIAQNHISPHAYKQNEVVTALNGTSIEIIHTDAEGRMVLADTLTMASKQKPDWMIDFATLTGSMVTALAEKYSGVLANRPELAEKAVAIGAQVGERLCAFPFDEDYDEALESKIADIKQCTLDGAADHIHAARFLSKFIENDVPWLHIDLSAYNHKGGLGAVASDVNGFGVALTLALLKQL